MRRLERAGVTMRPWKLARFGMAALTLVITFAASSASAYRFEMVSGSIEVFLRESGTDLASIGPFDLNGTDDFTDFSDSPIAMSDFQFSALGIQDQAIAQLAGGGSLPGL